MNVITAFPLVPAFAPTLRASRRIATRRDVIVPCQAVRERDFTLLADRTIDISVDGLLLPVREAQTIGEQLIVSFPIPGIWIDAECTVTRIVRGRRPCDDGALAIGVVFDRISPSARAALAGYLHGKPPPLPRRGPLSRLRRGEDGPQLADEPIMSIPLTGGPEVFANDNDIEELESDLEAAVDPVGLLRELADAWKRLTLDS